MATLKVFNGSVWVVAVPKAFTGSVFTEKLKFFNGSVWINLFDPPAVLALNVTPASINKFSINCPHTSDLLTASPSGGRAPYTYAWTFQTGGAGLTIDNPTSKTTTITQSVAGFRTGTLLCTVTDDATDTATDTSSITMECGT